MKNPHPTSHPAVNRGYDDDDARQCTVLPNRPITVGHSFQKKGNSWFVVSEIPTDLTVQVEDITFYVHKYALLSKCGYVSRVDLLQARSNPEHNIKLDNLPGGLAAFETVLKFCYGFPIELSPNNIAPLRCASEFLEMTEELEDGNLISKTESFLTFIVLPSWRDSIIVLKTCENLSPWAENLQIVRRCCDSISNKAFRESNEDISSFRIDHFVRIISVLKAKGADPERVGSCIMNYAEKWLLCEINREEKLIIESLISVLPNEKEGVTCNFLLWMLKMAMVYEVTPALITELEKKVGLVLQDANVKDILIPSTGDKDHEKLVNSPKERTMHNTDVVQRILEYFLMHEQQQQQQKFGRLDVSKLLDNYLAEIAKDPNLTISKFQVLAEALPESSRICHDGLYRAIDTYLKTHPSLSEQERRRLCKIMHCEKLSLDACMHVAQNDRLPLKTVVQVLFSEQVKMRAAMQGKEQETSGDNHEEDESWSSAKREIKNLKLELEKVKTKMAELQRDYSELQREYEKMTNKQRRSSGWSLGWKKIRNSNLFNGKVDADERGEGEERSDQAGCSVSLKRRMSMS